MLSYATSMIWSGWAELGRVTVVGTLGYLAALLLLRAAGQQALTKMTAYGLLVTVALGSVLATAVLSSQVKLDKAALGFGLLLGLQRLIAWASKRSSWVRSLVNNEPMLLVHKGQVNDRAMQRTNTTRDELEAALRAEGRAGLDGVGAMVLETDGSISVIAAAEVGDDTAVEKLVPPPRDERRSVSSP
jgi:uncharacterized membrane protein YcaP (DUF421 family)